MRLIGFAVVLAFNLLAPLVAETQQAGKVARIGVLHPGAPATSQHFAAAFDQGLRELGYLQGQNIVVERRFAEAKSERLFDLAAELVRLKVDVIVTSTDPGIAAVKQQTQTIPIVMANSTDPVGTGFVASLARPGGNVTGLSSLSPELGAKRLELLKEALPGLSRVAIVWNPDVRDETDGARVVVQIERHPAARRERGHIGDARQDRRRPQRPKTLVPNS